MTAPRERPPKEELQLLYQKEGATISSVARHYQTSNPTVRNWLNHYSIPRKSHKQASTEANNRHRSKNKPNREILLELYDNSNIKELEKYFRVGQQTIYGWLNEYDIPIRNLSESCLIGKQKQHADIQFDKNFLDEKYDRTKPISVLAENLGVSRNHIRNQLDMHGIDIVPVEPRYRSKAEISLADFLIKQFPHDEWEVATKTLISPYEIDIVNHTKKLAIEYCGLYWHCEGSSGKDKNYHKQKFDMCHDVGYELITVFDTDDLEKIKSLLLKKLGKTKRVGARKTTFKFVDSRTARDFHDEHHIHSFVGAKHHFGLYTDENDLLMVASFGKNRFGKDHEYECIRISSHSNITVVGGVSKLIKNFIRFCNPKSIVTFADLRFGRGNVYSKCGFNFVKNTPPNYWYSYKYTSPLYSRVKFQKHKLGNILENFDPSLTEYENMFNNGWDRIWDCGNAKFEWINEKRRD
jgi:transposase